MPCRKDGRRLAGQGLPRTPHTPHRLHMEDKAMSACKILAEAEDFAALRQGNGIYVDKTGFLLKFLSPQSAVATMMTHPWGFGKTLFLSMLSEFFDIRKDSRRLFAGLKVSANEELCRKWMNRYPVLFLSLKGAEKPAYAQTLTRFQQIVSELCNIHGYLLSSENVVPEDRAALQKYLKQEADEDELAHSLAVLSGALCDHYGRSVIVLVDECDTPLAAAARYGYYEEMEGFMRNMLGDVLKGNRALEFGILAGCMSTGFHCWQLGNLRFRDLSVPVSAEAFGFTQGEVDRLLEDTGLSSRREEIREWYGGYCMGHEQNVFCPWSIMHCLATLQSNGRNALKACWSGSRAHIPILDFVRNNAPEVQGVQEDLARLCAGEALIRHIDSVPAYPGQESSADNFWSLLCMAGFLTRCPERSPWNAMPSLLQEMALVVPNRDVHSFFRRLEREVAGNTGNRARKS